MSKPALVDISHGQQSWDTTVNANMAKLTGAPIPIKEYANLAALLAAGPAPTHDHCLAVTTSPAMLWISTGTGWVPTGIAVAVHSTGALPAAATYTWTAAFPAKVRRIGVAGRVTTLITGATSVDVGNHAAAVPDMYANDVAVALDTTFADAATVDPGGWSATAQDVVLTANGGNFSAGVMRLYAFYIPTHAPTS